MKKPTKKSIYLDYNATTPPADFLQTSWQKHLDLWGNPSSVHQVGQSARYLFWSSKQKIAQFINCKPLELIATSGGSEANNMAIKGLVAKYAHQYPNKTEILVSSVEHPSVKAPIELLKKIGMTVRYIPVSPQGTIDKNFYQQALSDKTFLVSVMYANNETGHIFPIADMAKHAHAKGAFFHCDMVQALGKIPINLQTLPVDTASFSAHKFYALKGSGVLYCRKGLLPESLVHGGPQERRRRAGTENVLGITCFARVAEKGADILKNFQTIKKLRDTMEKDITTLLPEAQIIGATNKRLHNTSAIYIPHVEGETVLMNMDLKGYAFSVGSACHSGSLNPSETLLSMGFSENVARSTFRISLGIHTKKSELKSFVKDLKASVDRIRKFSTTTTISDKNKS